MVDVQSPLPPERPTLYRSPRKKLLLRGFKPLPQPDDVLAALLHRLCEADKTAAERPPCDYPNEHPANEKTDGQNAAPPKLVDSQPSIHCPCEPTDQKRQGGQDHDGRRRQCDRQALNLAEAAAEFESGQFPTGQRHLPQIGGHAAILVFELLSGDRSFSGMVAEGIRDWGLGIGPVDPGQPWQRCGYKPLQNNDFGAHKKMRQFFTVIN